MIRSYLKIAWRNLLKNKAYSFINICGLGIGLSCALVIGLFIADEYSYDTFHQYAADIYRVVQQQNRAGELYDVASSPALMGKALRADFPEVINSCLLGYKRSGILQQGTTTVESPEITMTDDGFLKMFDFKLLRGNPEKVFTEPNQVVITDRMAVNLFGTDWASDKEMLGKTIAYDKNRTLVLAGVVANPPTNSHIQFDAILTYDGKQDGDDNWFSNNYHTYIQLRGDADPGMLNQKLAGYIKKYMTAEESVFNPPVFSLQPLKDIYLHSDFDFHTDWNTTSSILYVRVFFAVGMIVLIIAVFNFINLSTARAMRRAKEVGVRKTIGAYYRQLMTQFLAESLLITTISVVFALALVGFTLPFLNELASKSLTLPLFSINFITIVVFFTITVSILAGLYPSIYLSNFQPVKVLKGVFDVRSGQRFRQILIVTQFTLTVVLISSAIVIYRQLGFLRDKNLGFDKSQLIYLETETLDLKKVQILRNDLRMQTSIGEAALASNSLIDVENSTFGFDWEGKTPEDRFLITRLNVDPYYFSTTGMKLITGRNFSSATRDTASYIINQTAARRMGWTQDEALGKSFSIWGMSGYIVGVIQDFHFRPMTAVIEPLVFMCRPDRDYSGIMVKANNARDAIVAMEKAYKRYEDVAPVHYNFVDEQLQNQYRVEQRTGKLVLIFSCLAIFVACLGLYGLATFSAERRTKEIGIRKVMGASIGHVSMLLSRDFIFLVTLSIALAFPAGFMLMRSWLQGFVYHIALRWHFFLMAGGIALSIAAMTVLYHGVTAARMNPVKSLRAE